MALQHLSRTWDYAKKILSKTEVFQINIAQALHIDGEYNESNGVKRQGTYKHYLTYNDYTLFASIKQCCCADLKFSLGLNAIADTLTRRD
jgi:hypothetical protein